jgi:LCP family protein required for cell wall assembly
MQKPQGARPRARSPFTAAFLSLLFPGLGHLYAGAPMRALGFAAAPLLLLALMAGVVLRLDRIELLGAFVSMVGAIFVFNIVALVYRLVAIVDAYRVVEYLNAHAASGDGRLGRARLPRNPLSIAGLLAVVLVMVGSHAVVARYDLLAQDALGSCIFIGQTQTQTCDQDPSSSPGPSGSAEASTEPDATPTPTPEPPTGSQVPDVSIPPWDGKQRLNILLIGADEQGGGHNTDTMIVVSIDPKTSQVVMFQLPRDTVDVPIPVGSPARKLFGSVYAGKINSYFVAVRRRADLYPGTDQTRGYTGLKDVLGNLYGLDIKYFVEVNFQGFRQVVDALGGVTINVQVPVVDNLYPSDTGRTARVYIPAGIQHMTGAQALVYARSRHGSDDFDRGARQQRVITSMREQADVATIIPRIPDLIAAVKATVQTDIPQSELAKLAGLASSVATKDIRSYVFS